MSKNLYRSIAVSFLLMLSITALSSTAFAQATTDEESEDYEDDEELEEVVITGSVLRRIDDSVSPVTVMSDGWLEERGINTVSEALQRLPANNAGTITNNWNVGFNFATGATAPALRGLTVQSTLSIADGLRVAPYPLADDGQRNFVDLNTFPNATIERIEVLRDGASSTYGADAIAGVVNVITKKEIQGLHTNASLGFSQHGGGDEQRVDFAWGNGDLDSDGHNFYIAGEYMKMDTLYARDRWSPWNSGDWTSVCGSSGSCLTNHNWNGITPEDGSFNGFISVPGVTFVRPVLTDTATSGSGRFQYLNSSAGCRNWPTVNVDPAVSGTSPSVNCEVDIINNYQEFQPEIERKGLALRYTANIGDSTQFYASANYYITQTFTAFTPLGFNGTPPPPRPSTVTPYNVLLPVYVCSTGVGTQSGLGTGCTAANGTLNPNNPFAAQGLRAQAFLRNPNQRDVATDSRVYRVATGFSGDFGDGWRYNTNFTSSEVDLTRTQNNYLIPQRIMDVVADGSFNFNDPSATDPAVWEYISPENETVSVSRLWLIDANIAKDLWDLGGGTMQAAVGMAYRHESIDAPSGNPANDSAPYTRYYSVNAVGTAGSRNVTSAYFEIDMPFHEMVDVVASGRYDDYSSGQSSFSPKVGFLFEPIDTVGLRGTWSQGFRIPSFNEAFGLPTTGYVNRGIDCTKYADFCAAHGNNAYVTAPYSLGLTQTGDPALDPEESNSFTFGLIWQATPDFNLTVDLWQIEVDGLITGVTNTSEAEDQYYSNNGVVNLPGITVLPGQPDPAFPNALPVIGFVESSYTNQDSQKVSGFDFAANYAVPFGDVKWITALSLSYLAKYELKTDAGDTLAYEGTLSPCNITSCSGAPQWRASWGNTFEIGEKTTATLTTYYTSGLDTASLDYGGVPGDCQFNADNFASTVPLVDGTPYDCKTSAQWNIDLTVLYQWSDRIQLSADVLNVFDIKPKFDPAAAYGLYGFNPAWGGPNIMGRYFRFGVKLDFE